MISNDPRDNALSPSRYAGYVLGLFVCLFVRDLLRFVEPILPEWDIRAWSFFGFTFFLQPLAYAVIYSGIEQDLRGGRLPGIGKRLPDVFACFWRFFLITLPMIVIFTFILNLASPAKTDPAALSVFDQLKPAILYAPFFVFRFFWFGAVASERGHLFRGLERTFHFLVRDRRAWPAAVLLGVFSIADNLPNIYLAGVSDLNRIIADGVQEGLFAILLVWASMRILTAYRRARVELFGDPEEEILNADSSALSQDIPAGVLGGLAILSFLPLFNLAALIAGWIQVRRREHFSIAAPSACVLGGFFTLLYLLMIVGTSLPRPEVQPLDSYQFLAEADPSLQGAVDLLEGGEVDQAQTELNRMAFDGSKHNWALDCARGLTEEYNEEALACFRQALDAKPDRGEFYYLYGQTLLDDGNTEEAAANFELARQHGFQNDQVDRLHALARNAYTPSRTGEIIWMGLVLIFLFTVHEFGHAYAAWRLGDDTAKDQGRLTLNPLAHLDPIGSLLLPGILLWRDAGFIIGWAKPVPVDRSKFANPRRDDRIVSFAGPAVNLLVVLGSFLVLVLLAVAIRAIYPQAESLNLALPFGSVSLAGVPHAEFLAAVFTFLKKLMYVSLMLGFFNLMPIPPLDGSWILSSLLPERASMLFEKLRPYSFIFILIIFTTSVLDAVLMVPLVGTWKILSLSFTTLGFF